MSRSTRSSSRSSWRMALRRLCSAATRRANRALRRTSKRSQFTAARTQAWMKRLRSMAACRSSSKDESGSVEKNKHFGGEVSIWDMVGPSRARGVKLPCDGTAVAARSTWAGCLPASGLRGLKERFAAAGIFLEIFWRFPKIACYQSVGCAVIVQYRRAWVRRRFPLGPLGPLQDQATGANISACASVAASSIVANTAPAAIKSFSNHSSASIR